MLVLQLAAALVVQLLLACGKLPSIKRIVGLTMGGR